MLNGNHGVNITAHMHGVNITVHPRCIVCNSPTSQYCGKCKNVFYCSSKCQTWDWVVENHSEYCRKSNNLQLAGNGGKPNQHLMDGLITRLEVNTGKKRE